MEKKDSVLNGYGFVSSPVDSAKHHHFCDPCKFFGKKIQAKGYCKQCEGHLCKDCVRIHKTSPETNTHVVISEAKFATSDSIDGILRCEEHQSVLESYCDEHDVLCCHECIALNHRTCKVLIPIQRAASGIREGTNISDLTSELQKLITRFMRMKTEEENEMKNATKQGEQFMKMVKEFRKRVNSMLDKAEAAMYAKKEEICKAESAEAFGRYKICENTIPVLNQAARHLEKLKKETSEQNAFIVTKKIESMIEKYRPVLNEMLDKRSAFTFKFVPNHDLINAMQSLGSVVVRTTEHFVGVVTEPHNASPDTFRKLKQSGEISVKGNSDRMTCTITGCAFLPDNKLVIVDETNKSLKVVGADNKVTLTHKLNSAPWDIVALSADAVAVRNSFSDSDKIENVIQVLSVTDQIKQVTECNVNGRPRAIVYACPNMYVACSDGKTSKILVLDETYKTVRTIRPADDILKQPQYMCVDTKAEKLYVSDFYNGVITLSFDGEEISRLMDNNLTEFGGITMDTDGIVYLCAGKPYGVYKLSKKGSSALALVTWSEGKIDPQAITYSDKSETFVVTSCKSNKAFCFSYV